MEETERFSHFLPTRIEFGPGSLERLWEEIPRYSPRSLLVVASPGLEKRRPELVRRLESLPARFFSKATPNPDVTDLERICRELKGPVPDLLIGIGGGSVLDATRVLSVALTTSSSLREILSRPDRFVSKRIPMILVPTTSGTASEVTPWATVWDFEEKKKLSLAHPRLYADLAVIDPTVSVGMPPDLTAQTGMDTLSHAVESLWSKGCGPLTELFSGEAIPLVLKHLPEAVSRPNDLAPRVGLARACLLAGMAFSQTRTAAAHSISYPLTLRHRVAHGIACSITLPSLMVENAKGAPERLKKIARYFGAETPEAAAERLRNLMETIRIPTRLRDLGLGREEIPGLAAESFTAGRMDNNICLLTQSDVGRMLEAIY